MSEIIVVSIITSIIGASLVTLISHLLTQRKTNAEVDKLRAETEKALADAEKSRVETSKLLSEVNNKIDKTTYNQDDREVRNLYNSSEGITSFDFIGLSVIVSSDQNKILGKGNMSIKQETLIVERTNIEGGYLLSLRKYQIDKKESDFIPKNDLASSNRKLHVSCEVKITAGTASLSVHFMKESSYDNVSENSLRVEELDSADAWKKLSLFFEIPSTQDCYLSFVESDATDIHNMLIRNILLEEKV